ncbi:hypothetical protein [Chitinophaga sp.]|uniref:hypothetical protein n=1 Tax=Chitinophaga sp. TaxID=1869181 RepID=UPI0031DFEE75
MKKKVLSIVLLLSSISVSYAQISSNTHFITGDNRPAGDPPGGTLGLEFRQAVGYIFAHNYATGYYLPVSTSHSRLLVCNAADDGSSALQVNGVSTFRSGMQQIALLTGTNTSGYALGIGVNDDGINFTNDSQVRGFNFSNERGRIMTMAYNGWVGIGTSNPQSLLAVAGTVTAQKVKVTSNGWADFVFGDGYRLPTLYELEKFVRHNKHLPDVPSAAEVAEHGVDLGEMDKKLLQKIEELTLYIIELQKQVDRQRNEMDQFTKKLSDR